MSAEVNSLPFNTTEKRLMS